MPKLPSQYKCGCFDAEDDADGPYCAKHPDVEPECRDHKYGGTEHHCQECDNDAYRKAAGFDEAMAALLPLVKYCCGLTHPTPCQNCAPGRTVLAKYGRHDA